MQFEPSGEYKVRPIAEAYDLSVATVYRAVETGELRAKRFGRGKGTIRITGAAIHEWRAAREEAAATSVPTPRRHVACVICGNDLDQSSVARYPVGHTQNGEPVFACETHRLPANGGGAA